MQISNSTTCYNTGTSVSAKNTKVKKRERITNILPLNK